MICDWDLKPLGTIRIYNTQLETFTWGSWLLDHTAPANAAIESALLVYDFAFFALHYGQAKFDVRKANSSVVRFHQKFGATLTGEDSKDYFFSLDFSQYVAARERFANYLPSVGKNANG